MCKTHTHHLLQKSYNWDGDRIIYNSTIANTRSVISSRSKYDVDIRELLLAEHNTVIKSAIENIKSMLIPDAYQKFNERKAGSFDYKVKIVTEFVEQSVKYKRSKDGKFDAWQFPDETLTIKEGDCEDRALLIAALCSAVGVSSYNIRVALGYVIAEDQLYAHAWVMYKNELGDWTYIEPNDYISHRGRHALKIEGVDAYIPHFVFNREHLWGVYNERNREELARADCFSAYLKDPNYKSFDPSFGGKAHRLIVLEAFKDIKDDFLACLSTAEKDDLLSIGITADPTQYICRLASRVIGVDITLDYDALAHFDNCQLQSGVAQLENNMQANTLKGLICALHGIQDFYAHSSFAHFARIDKTGTDDPGRITLANIHLKDSDIFDTSMMHLDPVYDGTGARPFDLIKFKPNGSLCKHTPEQVEEYWNKKIISGRFGQKHDSHGFIEHFQWVDKRLPDLAWAAGVPHNEDIAVDTETGKNGLYNEADYALQYKYRVDAAIRHTKMLAMEWMEVRRENRV